MNRFNTVFHAALILMALLALSLVAVQPFSRGQMLLTDDGTLHLYRIIVLDHSMRHDGSLYPRFSSALAYGYGAPLFNYFSPFAYYLPRTLHVIGFSFVHAYLAAMTVYLWVAMVGAYMLGRHIAGDVGGFTAAVAYLYAPYMLYNAVSRGTITEVAALALLPWVIWAVTGLRDRPAVGTVLVATVAYSLFIPLHNIVTLHGSLLLAAYGLLLVAQSRAKLRTLFCLAIVALMSLALTAFFWLPALAETHLIKLPLITAQLPMLDVTRHLRPLGEVLALPVAVDARQQQAPIPITVSGVALGAAAVALGVSLLKRTMRGSTLFWIGVLLLCLFMNTEASAFLWHSLPLFHYTQFAWRILGIASLSLAVLAAIGVGLVFSSDLRRVVEGLCVAGFWFGLILYATPFTYRPPLLVQAQTIRDAQNYERERGAAALSSYSEYLPVHADIDTLRDALKPLWDASDVINRWSASNTAQLVESSWTGTAGHVSVTSDIGTNVLIKWLYMPQWQVLLNGVAIETYPGNNGLLAFDIPAGKHEIEIRYALSSVQALASTISSTALLLVTGISVYWLRIRHSGQRQQQLFCGGVCLLAGSVGLSMFVVKILLIDTTDNMFHRSLWREAFFAGTPTTDVSFDRQVTLLHAAFSHRLDNQIIEVVTSWTRGEALRENLRIVYTLQDERGFEIARLSDYQIANLDTLRWAYDLYLRDHQYIVLPGGTLPGRYQLLVSIYAESRVLEAINAQGQPLSPEFFLGWIEVPFVSAITLPVPEMWSVQSHSALPVQVVEGQRLPLRLDWVAGRSELVHFELALGWKSGGLLAHTSTILLPLTADIVEQSSPGQQWQTYSELYIPTLQSSGLYDLLLEVSTEDGNTVTVPLGTIEVVSPARIRAMPAVQYQTDAAWANGIRMRGYTLTPRELTLVWQNRESVIEHLYVFVHMMDEGRTILYQYDEVPCGSSRPVAGWIPGEYIRCSYPLDPAMPNAAIGIGFYDPNTLERVLLSDGTDSFVITVASGN